MNAITLKNISKSFGDKVVLSDLNAVFEAGKISVIMGESGCGKTTLINIIMGLEKADSGELSGIPKRMSAVFQEDCLSENFSAVSNLRAVTGKKAAKEKMTELLLSLGLTEKGINSSVNRLSGGMKRRVAIARALIADSELIIMDEPFKGLDEETRARVASIVERSVRGSSRTLILITHDAADIELIHADSIMKMS